VSLGSWLEDSQRTRAIITSTGSLLVGGGQYGDYFVRNYQTDGTFVELYQSQYNSASHFVRLGDGRILVTGLAVNEYRILSISADGQTVNQQPYSYFRYSWESNYSGEVACGSTNNDHYYACAGYNLSSLFSVGQRLFGITGESSRNLVNYSPGPVSLINLSASFVPDGAVATDSLNTIFLSGRKNTTPSLIAYNVDSQTEADITDDPTLTIRAMRHKDGKLYFVASKAADSYSYSCVLGVKALDGGTTVSPETTSCPGSDSLNVIPF
jgi:hypothetical protein